MDLMSTVCVDIIIFNWKWHLGFLTVITKAVIAKDFFPISCALNNYGLLNL